MVPSDIKQKIKVDIQRKTIERRENGERTSKRQSLQEKIISDSSCSFGYTFSASDSDTNKIGIVGIKDNILHNLIQKKTVKMTLIVKPHTY